MTGSHDPRTEVEKLRAHLAAHDKPIGFLLGAGTSCSVLDPNGDPLVPAVAALTTKCVAEVQGLGHPYDDILKAIAASGKRTDPNIEDLLSSIRRKIWAMTENDTLAGGTRDNLSKIESTIQSAIANCVSPEDARIPDNLPHHGLGRWI